VGHSRSSGQIDDLPACDGSQATGSESGAPLRGAVGLTGRMRRLTNAGMSVAISDAVHFDKPAAQRSGAPDPPTAPCRSDSQSRVTTGVLELRSTGPAPGPGAEGNPLFSSPTGLEGWDVVEVRSLHRKCLPSGDCRRQVVKEYSGQRAVGAAYSREPEDDVAG
jgi:hypothetical protein